MLDPLLAFAVVGLIVGIAGTASAYLREAFVNPGVVSYARLFGGLLGGFLGGVVVAAAVEELFGLDARAIHPVPLAAAVVCAALAPRVLGPWDFPEGVPDVAELEQRRDVRRLGRVLLSPRGPLGERDELATAAAKALGRLRDPVAAGALVGAVVSSPYEPVRRAALEELQQTGWPVTADILRRSVAAPNPLLARRAVAALEALGLPLEREATAPDEPVGYEIRRLPAGRRPGVQTLLVPATEDRYEDGLISSMALGLLFLTYLFLAFRFIAQGELEFFGGGLTDFAIGALSFIPLGALYLALLAIERIGAGRVAIDPGAPEARRGEELDLRVSTRGTSRRGQVHVVLRCTEYYNGIAESDALGPLGLLINRTSRRENILMLTAWEEERVLGGPGDVDAVKLRLPCDGPFSYEGEVLSLAWQVGVRVRRRWTASPVAWEPIWVLP